MRSTPPPPCDWIKILWASIQRNHDRFLRGRSGGWKLGMGISDKQLLPPETRKLCPRAKEGESSANYVDNLRQACMTQHTRSQDCSRWKCLTLLATFASLPRALPAPTSLPAGADRPRIEL
uniref:Uncharacterized protein n=1 Tax=Myotis myotis TaxID=51298 RepID=A0A7J7TTP5_MYOMY|nr:hypothetical protein mMyoMyo1_008944 [Myotis myotis]